MNEIERLQRQVRIARFVLLLLFADLYLTMSGVCYLLREHGFNNGVFMAWLYVMMMVTGIGGVLMFNILVFRIVVVVRSSLRGLAPLVVVYALAGYLWLWDSLRRS